jgi:hypothetical protein
MYDTWEIKNDSAVPILLTSVEDAGPGSWVDPTEQTRWRKFGDWLRRRPPGYTRRQLAADVEGKRHGVSLRFDDDVSETRRTDSEQPWKGQEVMPGETLTARVTGINHLLIRYRRLGPFGILERRRLDIFGLG